MRLTLLVQLISDNRSCATLSDCFQTTMRAAGLALLLLATAAPALALYDSSSAVRSLTPSDFNTVIKAKPALVEFYAPW